MNSLLKLTTLFSVLLTASLWAKADLNQALHLFQQAKYQESRKEFLELLKQDKRNAVYWFNLGHVYVKLGQLSYASQSYQQVVKLKSPLAPAALYYQARLSYQQGNFDQAKNHLLAMNQYSVPQNIRLKSQELDKKMNDPLSVKEDALNAYQNEDYQGSLSLLNALPKNRQSEEAQLLKIMIYTKTGNREEFQKEKRSYLRRPNITNAKRAVIIELDKSFSSVNQIARPFTLALDTSAGYNSNAYADGRSTDELSSTELRIFAAGTYQWSLNSGKYLRAGYSFFSNSFLEATDLSSTSHNLRLSYLSADQDRSVEITPYYQIQNWDGINVSNRLGLNHVMTYLNKSSEWGLISDINRRQSSHQDYEYLDSLNASSRPYYAWWSSRTYLEINFPFGLDGTKDITYSDNSRLPLTHSFYGPGLRHIFRIDEKLQLNTQLAYLWRNYANESLPDGIKRSDQELSYTLRLHYYFVPSSSLYLQYEGLNNSSNLGSQSVRDKNYKVRTFFLGFTWEYL